MAKPGQPVYFSLYLQPFIGIPRQELENGNVPVSSSGICLLCNRNILYAGPDLERSGQQTAGSTLQICAWQVDSLNVIILFIRSGSHYILAI